MKVTRILFVWLACVMVHTAASAQTVMGDWTLEAATNPLEFTDGHQTYIKTRYFFRPKWAGRFTAELTNHADSLSFSDADMLRSGFYTFKNMSLGGYLGAEYHVVRKSKWSAFGAIDLGYNSAWHNDSSDNATKDAFRPGYFSNTDQRSNALVLKPSVGADYWFGPRLFAGIELSYPLQLEQVCKGRRYEKQNGVEQTIDIGSKTRNFVNPGIQTFVRIGVRLNKPQKDSDGDGIPDEKDECPNAPGVYKKDKSGCPDVAEQMSVLAKNIYFFTDSDKLLETSYKALDQVAHILNDYPDATLSIEGHTDNTGTEKYNLDLSLRRAAAVKAYLIQREIVDVRMRVAGFGAKRPITTNDTEEGRAKNRRVELILIF